MLFHRPLMPADAPRLADHLKRLDDGDRRLRFAGHASNEAIDRFVGGIDWLRSFHIAAFEGAEIRGAA